MTYYEYNILVGISTGNNLLLACPCSFNVSLAYFNILVRMCTSTGNHLLLTWPLVSMYSHILWTYSWQISKRSLSSGLRSTCICILWRTYGHTSLNDGASSASAFGLSYSAKYSQTLWLLLINLYSLNDTDILEKLSGFTKKKKCLLYYRH